MSEDLEQRAFEDLDVIHGIADAGLVAATSGDICRAEDALREIKEIAEAWEEPDSSAFENYEGTHV